MGRAVSYAVPFLYDRVLIIKNRFINSYAFSHIALYGKAYIPAAKDTWTMMKNRGIDALVNDCLISPVVSHLVVISPASVFHSDS